MQDQTIDQLCQDLKSIDSMVVARMHNDAEDRAAKCSSSERAFQWHPQNLSLAQYLELLSAEIYVLKQMGKDAAMILRLEEVRLRYS